jgi:hypothetical protein
MNVETTRTESGFAGDPAEALNPPAAVGCCGGVRPAGGGVTPVAQTSPCCGTAAEAAASGGCCGESAKAEALTAGAGCCG